MPHPHHIDTTFMVLAPGKALINPEYVDVDRLPDVLSSWDILIAPEPDPIRDPPAAAHFPVRKGAQH